MLTNPAAALAEPSPIVFFCSSVGDTDLAIATLKKLAEIPERRYVVVPLTQAALERLYTMQVPATVQIIALSDIVGAPEVLHSPRISEEQLLQVNAFVQQSAFQTAYIGTPSPNEQETAWQLASTLDIPCIIAYEFLFTAPEQHLLWRYRDELIQRADRRFAVPLATALADFPAANAQVIGHLSLDTPLTATTQDDAERVAIRAQLGVVEGQQLAFLSGTTQPWSTDQACLQALLHELGNHPQMRLCIGIHPGVANVQSYVTHVLDEIEKYPALFAQLSLVIPDNLATKLDADCHTRLMQKPFIVRANISGASAARAADRIAQAVPGALPNQAALQGKPTYCDQGTPYLPASCFARNPAAFFTQPPTPPVKTEALGLEPNLPSAELMARMMLE